LNTVGRLHPRPEGRGFRLELSVTNRAGHPARTGSDDSHAQNSSGTTCDGCDHRDADGVNVDGRSLCRPCARNAETLITDGGLVIAGLSEAADSARDAIREFGNADLRNFSVWTNESRVLVDTEDGAKLYENLVDAIEREAGLRFCGAKPNLDANAGVLARFRLADDSDQVETLDQLATEFQNRREQAAILADEYAEMGHETLAEQYAGRAVGFADARAVIRHEREGDADE